MRILSPKAFLAILWMAACSPSLVTAQQPSTAPKPSLLENLPLENLPNFTTRTLGGMQYWADVALLHQWRIQQNAVTGHYRLLDPSDRRLAFGTLEHCQAELARIAAERAIEPMRGEVVLVLHGLFRTRGAMSGLCEYLREHTPYEVIDVGYPSTRGGVGQHARALAQVMHSLQGVDRVHFVAHSLGNLVIRHYLGDLARAEQNQEQTLLLPAVGRFVMLAPPNHQPQIAVKLGRLDFTGQIAGPALRELSTGWAQLEPLLATPPTEFGILAGGQTERWFQNPLIEGDSDLVVTVESTRLDGARDFRVLPTEHTFLMNDEKVQAITAQFLQHGYFESEAARQPIGPAK